MVLLNFFLLFSIISKDELGTRSKEARYIFCSEAGTSLAKKFVIEKKGNFKSSSGLMLYRAPNI